MQPERDETEDVPTPEEIRAQLDRMLASGAFRRSRELAAFLRFVVEAALLGKSDRIKGYTIGVEVLRRNATFRSAARSDRAARSHAASPDDQALLFGGGRGRFDPDRASAGGHMSRLLRAAAPTPSGDRWRYDADMRAGRSRRLDLIDRLDWQREPIREALVELRRLLALISAKCNPKV
jgi:hypothetical protein